MATVSCASSVSVQKSPQSRSDNRSKSCDTVCSSNSSCFFKRRKPMNPLAYSLRPTHHKTNPNSVKQRVMSAKMLKVRQLQSQLNDANFHLAEVTRENQTLKTLQKRQDKALSKYENTSADLPRLLHSHEEEIKVLTEKNRNLRKYVKELSEQLKQKEEELNKTREQLSHLEKLNKDKHLIEREKLMEKMEDLKLNLQKSDEQISTLNRKLILETKISKQRLNAEIVKHRQCQKELLHAFDEIDRLSGLLDTKENIVRPRNPKFNKLHNRDSISMVSLNHYQTAKRNMSNERLGTLKESSQTPVTDVKLEPLVNGIKADLEMSSKKSNDGFKAPIENIKQRLSSGSLKIRSHELNGLTNHSSEMLAESRENSAESFKSRPTSSLKLEKLPSMQENHRIQGKMKRENDHRHNSNIHKENLENVVSDDEVLGSDQNENVETDHEIIVRYDFEKDNHDVLSPDDLIRKHTNHIAQNNTDKGQVDENSDQETKLEHDSDDEDLVNVIQKFKKDKLEKTKLLDKPKNHNKKSFDGNLLETSLSKSTESEEDIEQVAKNFDAAICRATENSKEEFDKKLGSYCSEVLSSVKNCGKVIKAHKDSLESSKKDTDTLLETFKKTEQFESKLKKSFFNMDDDMDLVKEILNEEYKFQAENKVQKHSTLDKNSNIEKKPLVNLDNKKKLLATLRAIDNGDSVDSIEEPKQETFIKERYSHVAH